jgi:transcriptional regulator with XRE-family HTH domain
MKVPPKATLELIGRRLRETRTLRGLTLEELGKKAGLQIPTIHKYETGRGKLIVTLVALADALDVPVARLLEQPEEERKHGKSSQRLMMWLMGRLQQIERRQPKLFHLICKMVALMADAKE